MKGFPTLNGASMMERREDFRERFDYLRKGILREPRGYDAIVGAVLTPPVLPDSDAGVIFVNDVSYLGMCGHGTIGVAETLRFMGRTSGATVRLDTPVGLVEARLHPDSRDVTFRNIPSFVLEREVAVELPEPYPRVTVGDSAYGGNGFFIAKAPMDMLSVANLDYLMAYTIALRDSLRAAGHGEPQGKIVDHIELFADQPGGSKVFVLCPGRAYDRSPCGTGTSAKLALLAETGHLAEGETWRQESVTGGVFTARYSREDEHVIPWITGRAFITGRYEPVFDPEDPFVWGI